MSRQKFDSYSAKILSKYKYPEIAKRHVNDAIHIYKNLRPDSMIFNDESTESACLRGTIPINYKRKCYNIPICIRLLDSYPFNSPICYVKPSANMIIKASQYVDTNGRVYLPYLHEWNPDTYGLVGLIQVMIAVFSEQPPVFTKPYTQVPTEPSSGINSAPVNIPGLIVYPPTPAIPTSTTTLSNISQNNKSRITTKDYPSLYSSLKDKKHLHEVLAELQAEIEVLKKNEEDFNKEKLILEENISCLKIQQSELEKHINNLKAKEGEMDELSAKVNKQK